MLNEYMRFTFVSVPVKVHTLTVPEFDTATKTSSINYNEQ